MKKQVSMEIYLRDTLVVASKKTMPVLPKSVSIFLEIKFDFFNPFLVKKALETYPTTQPENSNPWVPP